MHFDYGSIVKFHRLWVWAYAIVRALARVKLPLPRRLRDIAAGPVPRGIDLQDHFLAVLQRR